MIAVSVIVGLATTNFMYQFLDTAPNYLVAFERTWFQAAAVLSYSILLWVNRKLG